MEKINAPLLQENEDNKTPLFSCALLLANGAVGAGILTLTLAVSKIGWSLGLFMFVFFGCFAGLTNGMLYLVQRYTRQTTYSGCVRKMYGRKMEIFSDIVQLLYSFGACVGYAIIIADELHLCLTQLFKGHLGSDFSFLVSREFVLMFVTGCLIIPIALQKKITALRYTSFLAIAGIVYLTIIMVSQAVDINPCGLAEKASYSCHKGTCAIEPDALLAVYKSLGACVTSCQHGVVDHVKSEVHAVIWSSQIFLALPVFCYGHCSQVQFIPIISDLKNSTKKRVTLVIFVAYVIIFSIYTINALSGYMSYCGYAAGNVLNSYSSENTPILIGRFIIAIALCFTFPLYGYNVREVIMKMLGMNPDTTAYWKHAAITITYVLFSTITALFLDSLYTVVALTGALGGSLIEAIIPSILYLKYIREINDPDVGLKTVYASIIIIIGVVIAVLGTAQSIASLLSVCFIFYFSVKISIMTQNKNSVFNVPPCRAFCGISIIVFSIVLLGYRELLEGSHLSIYNDILRDAYLLPTDEKVISAYNRDIVLLQSNDVKSFPGTAPADLDFDMHLGGQLQLHRVVEYCQWKEYKPVNASSGSQPIYEKTWVPKLIDSSKFSIPEGHENDQRDPFPEMTPLPKFSQAKVFNVDYDFFSSLEIPYQRYVIKPNDVTHFPIRTQQYGFYFASPNWYYSKKIFEGLDEALKYDGVQWLSEEEEYQMASTCETGDIRVAFEYKPIPKVMTFVGIQNDNTILPVRFNGKTVPIAVIGNATAEMILDEYAGEEGITNYYLHFLCGFTIALGMLCLHGCYVPFRYLPHLLRSILTGLLITYIECITIWIFVYGFDNTFVYKSLLWFGSHLLLSFLLNTMFYMIRLYRFAIKMKKEKKE